MVDFVGVAPVLDVPLLHLVDDDLFFGCSEGNDKEDLVPIWYLQKGFQAVPPNPRSTAPSRMFCTARP